MVVVALVLTVADGPAPDIPGIQNVGRRVNDENLGSSTRYRCFRANKAEISKSQDEQEAKTDAKPACTARNNAAKHRNQVHDPRQQLVQDNGDNHCLARR